MILKSLSLQNFRNYSKTEFSFSPETTIVVGQNGIGKSNLIEAIFLLSTGKSFRPGPPTGGERQLVQFGKDICRIKGEIISRGPAELLSRPTASLTSFAPGARRDPSPLVTPRSEIENTDSLEIVFAEQGTAFLKKKYLVNGVARRRTDFAGNLTVVLFTPLDLDLVSGQPSNRRHFLDEVLEQVDGDYRIALNMYTKGLRQRNALLEQVQETGRRNEKLFSYWDELLIKNGSLITKRREDFIGYINEQKKDFFKCTLFYDKSVISSQRLEQYKSAEIGAGVTLVGPHRDDVKFMTQTSEDARYFASRGQQRLIVLEMKLSQINYTEKILKQKPILLLDDIFSELDSKNINKIFKLMDHRQVIITTTHEEFIKKAGLKEMQVIELGK